MPDSSLRRAVGPAVWYGDELARRDDWIVTLTGEHLAELQAAAHSLISSGTKLSDVKRDSVMLPGLDAMLAQIENDVVRGRGFVLLRGLPVEDWGLELTACAYWLIGSRLGDAVPQNAAGHLLGHVLDLGNDPDSPLTRIYTTAAAQEFHTDSCDIVGLLCLRPARKGGASSIASSTTIYNEIVRTRPELAAVLMQPFTVDRKGEIPIGKGATYRLAVFHDFDGEITAIYARSFIRAAQERPETTRLTPAQIEAMDLIDALAASDRVRLDMDFRPGDIQFLHNHQILHARTAYEDFADRKRKRHLLRLWLSARNGRPLPPGFAERYGTVEPGAIRGGIRVPGVDPVVSLTP
jgi:hypothetical protein